MAEAQPATPDWPAFARAVITRVAQHLDALLVPAPDTGSEQHAGVFVTLFKLNRLRGCMGTLDATLPLPDAVRQAAICAAAEDPRFPPMAPGELPDVRIEVSILSPPQPMQDLDELELGYHGVIVQRGRRRGLFLPQVALEHKLDKEALLSRCCDEKAGLPADAWKQPDTQVLLFTARIHRE